MNIFGVHICQDEIMPMIMAVPFAGMVVARCRAWFNRKRTA